MEIKNNHKFTNFTADFRGKKVSVGGKLFAAGLFFCNSLNEYWLEAPTGIDSDPNGGWLIANRLMSVHIPMWNISDSLTLGYIDETESEKLHINILYILKVIAKARPFRYLDLVSETKRCDSLFGAESVTRINTYLKEKAGHTLQSGEYWLSHRKPDSKEIKRLEIEEKHLQEYITALEFYNSIGLDMNAAYDFGVKFAKRAKLLPRRNENYLIRLAMDCMANVPFVKHNEAFRSSLSPQVEYIAISKNMGSKNYLVGKRLTFTRFLDFLVADFFEGLSVGHYPQRCENCGRYFLKTNARHQKYCTLVDPKDPLKRTCNAIAAAKGRAEKELHDDHPIRYACETRLKVIRIHLKRGKIDEIQAQKSKENRHTTP